MLDRLTSGLALALVLVVGAAQVAGCLIRRCDSDLDELLESGEYVILKPYYGEIRPEYEDLDGAQLIVDRDAETSIIRYTRDGTTYEVRHTLDAP